MPSAYRLVVSKPPWNPVTLDIVARSSPPPGAPAIDDYSQLMWPMGGAFQGGVDLKRRDRLSVGVFAFDDNWDAAVCLEWRQDLDFGRRQLPRASFALAERGRLAAMPLPTLLEELRALPDQESLSPDVVLDPMQLVESHDAIRYRCAETCRLGQADSLLVSALAELLHHGHFRREWPTPLITPWPDLLGALLLLLPRSTTWPIHFFVEAEARSVGGAPPAVGPLRAVEVRYGGPQQPGASLQTQMTTVRYAQLMRDLVDRGDWEQMWHLRDAVSALMPPHIPAFPTLAYLVDEALTCAEARVRPPSRQTCDLADLLPMGVDEAGPTDVRTTLLRRMVFASGIAPDVFTLARWCLGEGYFDDQQAASELRRYFVRQVSDDTGSWRNWVPIILRSCPPLERLELLVVASLEGARDALESRTDRGHATAEELCLAVMAAKTWGELSAAGCARSLKLLNQIARRVRSVAHKDEHTGVGARLAHAMDQATRGPVEEEHG
jgi:hypothetical protein